MSSFNSPNFFREALRNGYSPEEILEFTSQNDEKMAPFIEKAQSYGYKPNQILKEILSQSPEAKISQPTRITGQLAARGVEKILGAPRESAEFLESLIPKKTLIKGAEKIGLGKGAEKLLKTTEKYAPYKLLPKEEDVHSAIKHTFGEAFEPQSKLEQIGGETFAEFAAMAFPFLGKMSPKRAFFTSLGANLAKEATEEITGSKEAGEAAKLGAYFLSPIIQPEFAPKFYRSNYKAAEKLLPENATFSSQEFKSKLKGMAKKLRKGGVSSADKPALDLIEEALKLPQGEQVPIDDLMAAKRKINIKRGDIYKQLEKNKPGIKTAKHNIDEVSKIFDATLSKYGKTNPQWFKHYSEANNAFAAEESSKFVTKLFNKIVGNSALAHSAAAVAVGLPAKAGKIAGTAAKIAVPYEASKLIYKIMKSKPLRKEYVRLLNRALEGNVKASANDFNRFSKNLDKYLQTHPEGKTEAE